MRSYSGANLCLDILFLTFAVSLSLLPFYSWVLLVTTAGSETRFTFASFTVLAYRWTPVFTFSHTRAFLLSNVLNLQQPHTTCDLHDLTTSRTATLRLAAFNNIIADGCFKSGRNNGSFSEDVDGKGGQADVQSHRQWDESILSDGDEPDGAEQCDFQLDIKFGVCWEQVSEDVDNHSCSFQCAGCICDSCQYIVRLLLGVEEV